MNKKVYAIMFLASYTLHSNATDYINKKFMYGVGATAIGAGILHLCAKSVWGDNYGTFFWQIAKHPKRIGAFAPCSTFTAKALTKHIKEKENKTDDPIYVLEVGAGSGVITKEIVQTLEKSGAPYHVDCIEIDAALCSVLEDTFASEHVSIHNHDIRTWQPETKYDFIISTLPLMQFIFDVKDVKTILQNYQNWAKDGAVVSYVTHIFIPHFASWFLKGEKKEVYIKKMKHIESFRSAYLFETEKVWRNCAPLYVYHMQITA